MKKKDYKEAVARRDADFDYLTQKEIKAALKAVREGDALNAAYCTALEAAWTVFKDTGCNAASDRAFSASVNAIRQGRGKNEIWQAGWAIGGDYQ